MSNTDHRKIEPGSCPWCGHKPHAAGKCKSKIRTHDPMPHGPDVDRRCLCARDTTPST